MILAAYMDLLALNGYVFISPWKLVAVIVGFACWALLAQWVDKDTIAVNTYRVFWNIIVTATGVALTVVMLFVPVFAAGFSIFAVALITLAAFYVVHRNGLVHNEDKILTPAHIKRVLTQGLRGKKKPKEVKERVRLRGADGKRCEIPGEEEERERYRLTQDLLWAALWNRAERIEVAPGKEISKVTYQVDGIRSDREGFPRPEADAVVHYLKTIAGLNLEELRKPQFGKIAAEIGDNKLDIEVRTDGSVAGEKLTLRVIGEETRYKVKDIGFTKAQLEQIRTMMESTRGLVLLSAPPGAGLTTTVYSFTRSHDAFLCNIQLLEYQHELMIDNVTQTLHKAVGDKTFAGDLQKLFRTDPDIVILPEMREQAASVIATEGAVQKQLVYCAINASDVFSALRKWMEQVGKNDKVAKCLLAITNQRLIRKLCPSCKQPYKPDPAVLKKLNLPADAVFYREPEPEYDKKGNPLICQHCQGTGYVGRTAVFDVLIVDDELRKVIGKAQSISEIQAYAVKRGGLGFQKHAMQKVRDGTTSIQEVTRVLRGGQKSGTSGDKSGAKDRPKPTPKPKPKPKQSPAGP